MSPTAFISLLLPVARECQRIYGIPVSVTLAQAALETGWGKDVQGNNLFGVKADSSWSGPVVMIDTHEYVKGTKTPLIDRFRLYKSWGESVHDHAKFIKDNPRYAPCFKEATGEGWARALQAAKYATDPNYADELIAVMNGRKMAQYDTPIPTI